LTDAAGGQTAKLGATGSNNGLLELNNSAHVGTVFLNSSGDSYLNGGNVMVGTTSVGGAGITVGKQYGGIDLTGGGGTFTNWGGAYGIYARSNVGLGIASVAGISFETAGGNERMRIDSSGRVGVGTSSPQQLAHINGTGISYFRATGGTGNTGIDFGQHSNGNGYIWHRDSASIILGTASTERMRIDSSGNVGIGTTTPGFPLDVSAPIGSTIGQTSTYNYGSNRNWAMRTNNYGSANWGGWSLEQSTGQDLAPTVARIGVHMNGNVGINMGGDASSGLTSINPATALHVGGDITVGSADSVGTSGTASIRFQNDNERSRITSNYASGGGGQMGFWTDTTGGTLVQRLTIKNDGNVGIGTTTPAAKLQVEALGIDTTVTSTTATTQVAIDSMVAATFRSARYTIQITNSTDGTYHLTEMLLIHNGTTPSINEFGTIYTGSAAEAVFTADINSGNVRILATPASTDAMAFKVVRHSITV